MRQRQKLWTVVPESRWFHCVVRQCLWLWLSASDKGNQRDESENWEHHRQTVLP